jgi:hypothetical protein
MWVENTVHLLLADISTSLAPFIVDQGDVVHHQIPAVWYLRSESTSIEFSMIDV